MRGLHRGYTPMGVHVQMAWRGKRARRSRCLSCMVQCVCQPHARALRGQWQHLWLQAGGGVPTPQVPGHLKDPTR